MYRARSVGEFVPLGIDVAFELIREEELCRSSTETCAEKRNQHSNIAMILG